MTRRAVRIASGVAALAFATAPARAQELGPRGSLVTATMEPDVVTIGQPFTVRVRVRAPKIATIHFPSVPDSGDAIEAVDPREVSVADDATTLDRVATYRLVAWNTGQRQPRLGDVVIVAAGIEQRFPVALSPVFVRSLLPADTAERVPKAVRDPLATPGGAWRWWVIAAAAAAVAIVYWWRRRRRRALLPPADPEVFVAAREAFGALERLALVEAGEPGRHVIAHVDVMRQYVQRRFPAASASLTGPELVRALGDVEFPVAPARVGALLERDAVVRFAGTGVAAEDARVLAGEARAIVRELQDAYEVRRRALERAARQPPSGKART